MATYFTEKTFKFLRALPTRSRHAKTLQRAPLADEKDDP